VNQIIPQQVNNNDYVSLTLKILLNYYIVQARDLNPMKNDNIIHLCPQSLLSSII
jgi:hypothetical protein